MMISISKLGRYTFQIYPLIFELRMDQLGTQNGDSKWGSFLNHEKFTLWWTNIAMENHHFSWGNPLFLWPFSIAFCMFTRRGNDPTVHTSRLGSQGSQPAPKILTQVIPRKSCCSAHEEGIFYLFPGCLEATLWWTFTYNLYYIWKHNYYYIWKDPPFLLG